MRAIFLALASCRDPPNVVFMYAYDDWALSVVAAAAGEEDVRKAFVTRSKNYRCNC